MRFVYMNVPDDERLSVFSVVNTNCLLRVSLRAIALSRCFALPA